jgi:hypothetical protein
LVNFFVSCVSRSELRCSGIHGWMSWTCWMINLNFTDPVAIQLGSIGYSCGPVLMILNRMKGSCCVLVFSSSQATGCRPGPASSCRVPALWGQKNDSMNDCSTSPLEEQVFGVIPLVPLFTVSF